MSTTTVQEQIFTLQKLQKNETEMAKIQHLLDSIPRKIRSLDARLSGYEQKFADLEADQSQLKKTYKDNEADVRLNSDRIERSQAKLNAVKTNKEYQAFLKEIEKGKSLNSRIEDEMLADLELIEDNEKRIKSAKDEYNHEAEKINIEKEQIKTKAENIRKELVHFQSEGEQILKTIAPALLARFKKIKTMIPDSRVIVSVADAVCGGCNMSIMPQTYNELQRSEKLMACPHCQRIIYHE